MSDTDEIDNREAFVEEYNRLARKVRPLAPLSTSICHLLKWEQYGVRPLVPEYPESSEVRFASKDYRLV